MQLGSTLFLASAVSFLALLDRYSAIEIEAFVAEHLKDIGLALLVLALLTMWQGKTVQRIASYVALAGAAYLLLQHGSDILAIAGGVHVY